MKEISQSENGKRGKSAPDLQRLAQLRAEFQKDPLCQFATKALLRLQAKNCDPLVVMAYVRRATGYKSGNLGRRSAPEIARRIRGMSGQLQKLAKRITKLRQMWGFQGRMLDADCYHIPEELENIAERLSHTRTKGFGDWHPQRDALLDLLEHTRLSTGRYHYSEVSLLLNAELVWRALKYNRPVPDFRYDIDSLKMIVQRWTKEHRAEIARLSGSKSATDTQRKPSTDTSVPN